MPISKLFFWGYAALLAVGVGLIVACALSCVDLMRDPHEDENTENE